MIAEDHWTVSLLYTGIFPTVIQSDIAEEKSFSNGNGSGNTGDVGEIGFPGFADEGSRFCIAWKYPSIWEYSELRLKRAKFWQRTKTNASGHALILELCGSWATMTFVGYQMVLTMVERTYLIVRDLEGGFYLLASQLQNRIWAGCSFRKSMRPLYCGRIHSYHRSFRSSHNCYRT